MAEWKDGLLVLAGGAMGLMLAAILDAVDDDEEKNSEKIFEEKPDAMNLLVSKIRYEAEAALSACKNDEEREKVLAQVENSVRDMQDNLQQKTEKIITDLKSQVSVPNDSEKISSAEHLKNITDTFKNLSESLDEALENLRVAKNFS